MSSREEFLKTKACKKLFKKSYLPGQVHCLRELLPVPGRRHILVFLRSKAGFARASASNFFVPFHYTSVIYKSPTV